MEADSRLFARVFAPVAWVSHWACTLRTAMTDKNEFGSEVEHIDHLDREKGAVNALLILACMVFAAASFIFGYDDKIISPVVALPEFVSPPTDPG